MKSMDSPWVALETALRSITCRLVTRMMIRMNGLAAQCIANTSLRMMASMMTLMPITDFPAECNLHLACVIQMWLMFPEAKLLNRTMILPDRRISLKQVWYLAMLPDSGEHHSLRIQTL